MVQNIVYKCWSINQGNYLKVTRKYGFVWHLVMPSYKSQTIIHMIQGTHVHEHYPIALTHQILFTIIKVFTIFFKYPITNASNRPLSVNDKTKIERKGYVVLIACFLKSFLVVAKVTIFHKKMQKYGFHPQECFTKYGYKPYSKP